MKKFLIFVFLISLFTLHTFALDGVTVEGVVKPFTVDDVSGTGITVNNTFYPYTFASSQQQYLSQIESCFNVQNNALVLVNSDVRSDTWQLIVYISASQDVIGDWYLLSYDTSEMNNKLYYTLTNGASGATDTLFYTYSIVYELNYDGTLISCAFGGYRAQNAEGTIYNQPFADYFKVDLFNYTDFGIAWCNNPVMYGDELLFDGGSTAPEEPLPDTPEYDSLLDAIIGLFFPSEDFISNKFNALRQKFVFADSFISSIEFIRDTFIDISNEPPVISINLSNAESDYNWGSTAVSLDLTWYTRYKPFVDALVSAIVTVLFLWRVFKNLPSIISGVQGVNKDDI